MTFRQAMGVLAAALGVAMAGCSGEIPGAPGEDDEAITNGEVDNGDPAVVYLQVELANSVFTSCTGEVVAPTIVLTAAHCVPAETKAVLVATGFDVRDAKTRGQVIKALKWTRHPQYNPNSIVDGYDAAVIELAAAVDSIVPLALAPFNLDGIAGTRVKLVGYGNIAHIGDAALGAGVRRMARNFIDDVTPLLLHMNPTTYASRLGEQCSGDSGGPALARIGGRQYIVGLSSFSSFATPDDRCQNGGYDTRIDVVSPFVAPFLTAR